VDPGTGLTILGTAIGSTKIIEKILGPTAEYLGEGLKNWTQKRIENVSHIFKVAEKRLGSKLEENGSVPPKVLRGILNEGSYCEDELSAKYFGGVLASSRTAIHRDDRGMVLISLLNRLSTYQIRTHYILYRTTKYLFNGQIILPTTTEGRKLLTIFIPFRSYDLSMDFTKGENSDLIVSHTLWGLFREGLISKGFMTGPVDFLKTKYSKIDKDGFIFRPSPPGVELFLWAFGLGNVSAGKFLDSRVVIPNDININLVEGAHSMRE